MSSEGVFAAAKCIRPYLEELLGSDAPAVDEELARLLNSGERDESVAQQLRALLEERPETSMFLDAVLDDAPYFRPPQCQPVVLKAEGYNPLPGDHTPPSASRYRCPVRDDCEWWSPGGGTPVPECPTHHTTLVTDDEGGLVLAKDDSFDKVEGSGADRAPGWPSSEIQPRQWRADIENHDPDTPLQVGADYAFLFSVDPENEGAAATEDFDESLFTDKSVEELRLTVQVSSADFDIRSEPVADLVVPRMGPAPVPARFVVAARHGGACTITAAVHLHGNFVNLLHFTAWAGTAGPATLTKVGRPPDALRHLEPRDMSLILQRASPSGYDCIPVGGGVGSWPVFLPITTEELAAEIDHVQQELLSVVKLRDDAGELVFQTGFQIPASSEQAALRTLAKAGGRLFRKLFFHPQAGPDAKELGDYLRAEASDDQGLLTLQVVDKEAAIPWALLYVGDISDDARLDWEYFLGLRHLIEQVPFGPLLPGRTLTIHSAPELTVGLNLNLRVGPDLVNAKVKEHQQRWQDLPSQRKGLSLRPRSTRTAVLEALRDPANGDQIVYFYCHACAQGRNDDTGRAAITMEPNSPLTLDDLNDNAGVSIRLPKQPLVFINACESADLTPLFYTGFVPYFLSRGARGVIGTQCKTPALFAIRFAESFFDRLFDGQPIGEAMLATRRDFLERYRNPLGLLYAVHCDIDTRIDPPMVAPSA